jgi:predicted helicase
VFTPLDLLDYIYAVLHNPSYREKYKEFLKIDFPRVPYPETAEEFWYYVEIGTKLRKLHLMEGVQPEQGLADFPVAGSNEVVKLHYSRHCEVASCLTNEAIHSVNSSNNGLLRKASKKQPRNDGVCRLYINDTQYFNNIPEEVWSFYIGGYQPAQKWLKDRKGMTLTFDDIAHYQKIVKVLKETDEIMKFIKQ